MGWNGWRYHTANAHGPLGCRAARPQPKEGCLVGRLSMETTRRRGVDPWHPSPGRRSEQRAVYSSTIFHRLLATPAAFRMMVLLGFGGRRGGFSGGGAGLMPRGSAPQTFECYHVVQVEYDPNERVSERPCEVLEDPESSSAVSGC
jgi:hypothetical protein